MHIKCHIKIFKCRQLVVINVIAFSRKRTWQHDNKLSSGSGGFKIFQSFCNFNMLDINKLFHQACWEQSHKCRQNYQKQKVDKPGINLCWNTAWDNLQYLKSKQNKLKKNKQETKSARGWTVPITKILLRLFLVPSVASCKGKYNLFNR